MSRRYEMNRCIWTCQRRNIFFVLIRETFINAIGGIREVLIWCVYEVITWKEWVCISFAVAVMMTVIPRDGL